MNLIRKIYNASTIHSVNGQIRRFSSAFHFPETIKTKEDAKSFVSLQEAKLIDNFNQADIAVLQNSSVEIHSAIRSTFANIPFWKLFWMGDYLASHLYEKLKNHNFIKAEYQMAYAVGKAEGALDQTVFIIQKSLDEEKVKALLEMSYHAFDPFILRNQIAAEDNSQYFTQLSKQVNSLVRNQIFGIMTLGLLSLHFGVPLVVALPSSLLGSVIGLQWMNLRYSGFQRTFIASFSESHQKLSMKLRVNLY
ncbi:hypothetical protein HDV04_005819 [Boothiomyces sp. JEL0838]|nr:hypothetical protein HDV04_005819 [Boothiomyces sp. JEL0838]